MSILQEAEQIINGPRREAYGPVKASFERIATVWSIQLGQKLKEPITALDVANLMMGFKLCRQANSYSRDNLVDICGYAALAQKIVDKAEPNESIQ
jgi:hypothetical protein